MPPRGILCLPEEMTHFVMLAASCINAGAFEEFSSSFPSLRENFHDKKITCHV